jgi:hypothetical protein
LSYLKSNTCFSQLTYFAHHFLYLSSNDNSILSITWVRNLEVILDLFSPTLTSTWVANLYGITFKYIQNLTTPHFIHLYLLRPSHPDAVHGSFQYLFSLPVWHQYSVIFSTLESEHVIPLLKPSQSFPSHSQREKNQKNKLCFFLFFETYLIV